MRGRARAGASFRALSVKRRDRLGSSFGLDHIMRTPLASTSRVKLESFVVSSRRAVSSAPIAAGRCFVSLPRCGSTSSSAPSLHDPFPRPAHAASPPRLNPWRHFSTTSNRRSQPSPPASSLSQQEYNSLSDDVFDSLVSQLEHLVDESPDGAERDWEIEYSQGVLTLKVPPTGTYVINKQPPNKQIWLSSPTR